MGGNPSKPSDVDVSALRGVLTQLQQMHGNIGEGHPGSWDSVGDGSSMQKALGGMQENVSQQIGDYYGDVTTHVNNAWTSIQGGITALTTLVQSTIDAHSNNDRSTASSARATNTAGQPGAAKEG